MATKKITVNAGDTFRSIAQREYGDPSKFKEVMQNNRSRLKAGSSIEIPDLTIKPGQPALATPLATPTAPNASQFAEMNKNASTIGAQAGQQAVQQVNTPVTPTAPVAPTPATQTPPLEFGTNVPQYAPVSTANNPQGIGAPNIGKPYYQGGKQTFDIFDKMKQGVISPNQVPVTPAEKEAVAMYQNYQKYQGADAQTLLSAIESGELTPDPTNLLWRALGEGGEPTDAMVQAYAMWDKGIKAGANGKRSQDPFLGGDWQRIQTTEDANAMINDFSTEDDTVDGEVVSSTDGGSSSTGVVQKGTTEYDMYRQTVIEMMGQQPTGGTDYQGKLNELRTRYNVQQDEMGLQSLDDEAMAIENDLIARRNQARSQPVAMGVIAGRVGEIERQQMERLNQVNRDRQYLANSLAQKQSIIGSMLDAYGADYESAVADFDKRYNRSMQAIDMFRSIRKDEVAEQSAIASAELAQQKFEEEKIQQRKADATAKLEVIYGAIQEGTMNPEVLAKPAMALQVAQMEIQAGMPIGTFAGLMSKHPDKTIKSTVESVNAKGEKILTFVMQDRNGTPTLVQENLGVDAKALQEIQKGVYDIAKAKSEYEMAPYEKAKKLADIENTKALTFAKDVESGRGVDYFSNYGAITGENGSPLWKWGLDVDLKKGDPVYAPFDGEVIGVKENGGFGKQVQIRDDEGNTVWLSHLDGYETNVGERVKAGQLVALGGNTGNTIPGKGGDGSHLDITIKKPDGSYFTAPEVKQYISGKYKTAVKTNASTTTTKLTESERKEVATKELKAKASTALSSNAGGDGYVSPEVYRAVKRQWAIDGDTKDFDKLYKDYINPTHYSDYGLDVLDKTTKEYFNSEAGYVTKKQEEIKMKAQNEKENKENERLKNKYAYVSNEKLSKLLFGAKTTEENNEIIKEQKRRGIQ